MSREELIRELESARERLIDLESAGLDSETLKAVVAAIAEATGEVLFHALTRNLAQALRVRYAFVSEVLGKRTRVRTLSVWSRSAWLENFEYDLKDTPCEQVVGGRFCFHPTNLRQTFPRDELLVEMEADSYLGTPLFDTTERVIGHIGVMDVLPMAGSLHDRSILHIFAARARGELERRRMKAELDLARDSVEAAVERRTQDLSRAIDLLKTQMRPRGGERDALPDSQRSAPRG
ncbi:MAG: GAF domain-containing protein [Planctomycetota bacterium]|nr:hypothetical protein [Planctomycetota bacterium]